MSPKRFNSAGDVLGCYRRTRPCALRWYSISGAKRSWRVGWRPKERTGYRIWELRTIHPYWVVLLSLHGCIHHESVNTFKIHWAVLAWALLVAWLATISACCAASTSLRTKHEPRRACCLTCKRVTCSRWRRSCTSGWKREAASMKGWASLCSFTLEQVSRFRLSRRIRPLSNLRKVSRSSRNRATSLSRHELLVHELNGLSPLSSSLYLDWPRLLEIPQMIPNSFRSKASARRRCYHY